eukprot:3754667-Ditylum_brightwellii.AAC.1
MTLTTEEHINRNEYNQLPNGKIKPSLADPTIWLDDNDRPWKLNAEPNAAYHQPYPVPVAFIRAHVSTMVPPLKVPNLKFISPNTGEGPAGYSEICANRYTGELVIEQSIMGTFNFVSDAPDAMNKGGLPTTGDHKINDIDPHNQYGGIYAHIAKGIPVGSLEKGPVVLHEDALDEFPSCCGGK